MLNLGGVGFSLYTLYFSGLPVSQRSLIGKMRPSNDNQIQMDVVTVAAAVSIGPRSSGLDKTSAKSRLSEPQLEVHSGSHLIKSSYLPPSTCSTGAPPFPWSAPGSAWKVESEVRVQEWLRGGKMYNSVP